MRHDRLALTLVSFAVATSSTARASDPTTAECLAASDASLQAADGHKLLAERTQLLVCAAASCPTEVRKECARRMDDVNAAIPSIIFQVKDASGVDVGAVKVTMDGEILTERLDGTALSIDPGEHTFVFTSAGQPPLEKRLVIREAEKGRHEEVVLGGGAALSPALASTTPAPAPAPAPAPPVVDEHRGLSTQRVLALVVAGIGVVGVAVGATFGLVAMSDKSSAQNICPDRCPTMDGVNKWRDAKSAGNVSTVAFVAGGVALGGAAAIWFTAPASRAEVGVGPGSVYVKGAW